ncbi:anti-sigma factor family protein [Nocardia alni]|uniref:anti-sigma factor family protein n=1 Tax=Nocardia alni TaxID=2815723 RepID=UPI0027E205B4|nr:zf-HC2 domain-containing protein [Nocardia alni]
MTEAVVPETGDAYEMWDAPYVLGALSRAERLEYEAHLAQCADCQAAVADLAGLPPLLGRVDPAVALALVDSPVEPPAEPRTAEAAEPPTELLPRLASRTRRQRRRGGWLALGGAVAAAAAAVAIAVPVTNSLGKQHTAPPAAEHVVVERQMDQVTASPITASVKLVAVPEGTRVEMSCTYAPSVTDYTWRGALWVVHTDGTEAMVAQWTARPGQTLTPDGTTSVPPNQIRSVEIRAATTNQLMLSSTF